MNVQKQCTVELTKRNIKNFWKRINKRSPTQCWEWTGHRMKTGYGKMHIAGKQRLATHVLFRIRTGNWVPVGRMITHKECHNPPCCNPRHLRLGTHQSNMNDMIYDGREYHPTGEHNGNIKLTNSKVRKIRILLTQEKLSYLQIANQFSISERTINSVKRGETWSHII